MKNESKLKCPSCGEILELQVYFDGCDFDSVKGEGSGFDRGISLDCENCGKAFPIGRIKNVTDFCENVEKIRPYGKNINH